MTCRPVCNCMPHCGLPPCTSCNEDHGGHDQGGGVYLCRDCFLEYMMLRMECSGCKRMRYRTDDATAPLAGLGAYLWGDRCECPEPRPPNAWQVRQQETPT